jgi:hypothetical protein
LGEHAIEVAHPVDREDTALKQRGLELVLGA